MNIMRRGAIVWLLLVVMDLQLVSVRAQGTAFTYQGRLNAGGNPANGTYDLAFSLYNTNTGGGVIAGPVTNRAIAVTNGLFTTVVDFGSGFFTAAGTNDWLSISVSTNGANLFYPLSPRQPITPSPYALYAMSAGTANSATSAGSAASATTANGFSGALAGDVTGTQGATAVAAVGGQPAANVAAGAAAANAATSANTPGTIVKRDASGNFSAGNITAVALSANSLCQQ